MSEAAGWSTEDMQALRAACKALEHPSFAARATDWIGSPIEAGLKRLPQGVQAKIEKACDSALMHALKTALKTMHGKPPRSQGLARKLHKLAAAASGAAGGVGGLWTLPLELPITTGIMLRAIADIARAEGEDLGAPAAQLACLEVFAMGGRSKSDDANESAYFLVRAALAREVTKAAQYILEKGLAEESAPLLMRLIAKVAQRFSVQVSEKVAAEAVPIIGAVGGATINVIFIDHFQSMARGHFTIRRLERKYGEADVREQYELVRIAKPGRA